jgi:hypothetical protein
MGLPGLLLLTNRAQPPSATNTPLRHLRAAAGAFFVNSVSDIGTRRAMFQVSELPTPSLR